jgi:uncharacterized protein YcbK (DUF882 family)
LVSRLRIILAGLAAILCLAGGAASLVTAAGNERTIWLHNIHTKETVSVVYKRDGRYVEAGLQQASHMLRDWRRNESTKMDPELIDLLWEIHTELGSKEPIHIISGYRSRATNDQLRRTVGGQASESRHILGKAADVHFPDVPIRKLRYSALIRERGGVGYYPTSAIPFVHVDTDRVRAWPRLPRHELALLFPSGSTRHAPADGGSITPSDVKAAQARHRDLAEQIAEFHGERLAPKSGQVQVAQRSPGPEPKRPEAIRPAVASSDVAVRKPAIEAASLGPSAGERAKLAALVASANADPVLIAGPAPARRPARLASLDSALPLPALVPAASGGAAPAKGREGLLDAGQFGLGGNWVPAPAFDEEHPEELSYRPFPIGPLLTSTPDEPLMADLVPHDVARTLDFIDQPGTFIPLRFRPGEQTAQLLWSQQFTGSAIGLARLDAAKAPMPSTGVPSRSVRTTQK